MNEQDFYRLVKETVADYANAHLDKADGKQDHPGRCLHCLDVQDPPEQQSTRKYNPV